MYSQVGPKSQRTSYSLRTDDIYGANTNLVYERFKRKTPRNPLEPFEQSSPLGEKGKCELKYFGPKPKSRFLRDNMITNDIPGCTTANRYASMTTRNHIKTDDIPGATVKIYHKYYYDK